MLKSFLSSRSGNIAIMSGVLLIPMCLAVGVAVDYSRYTSAERHLQEIADATSLSLASTQERSNAKLTQMANDFLTSNQNSNRVQQLRLDGLETSTEMIDVTVGGSIPATFMALAGYDRLAVKASALAERAVRGNVEVSLVLDNTWSMSEADGSGQTRMEALKDAAARLVDELLITTDNSVRIALVPYADYVNVGSENRSASWLNVPSDYSNTSTSKETCVTETTVCLARNPKRTCERYRDGVLETYSCGNECTKTEVRQLDQPQCSGGKTSTTAYKWFGCVGSRTGGNNRLGDHNKSVKYPGYVETSQNCHNPIVRLTNDKKRLKDAIVAMSPNRGSYKPYTYIPAGLVWGLNTVSPTEPFPDGLAYDANNVRPRKVIVLMTDGENTLLYNKNNGKHASGSVPSLNAAEKQSAVVSAGTDCTDAHNNCGNGKGKLKDTSSYQQTNADTLSLCAYASANQIEIFTVAFKVDDATARQMLQLCATDEAHYYEASDSAKLAAAFSGIAQSLRVVRLAR